MTAIINEAGLVATTPRHEVTEDGLPITRFRFACSSREYDRKRDKWVDGLTNWYTVVTYGTTATNVAGSISKGDRIVVAGKLFVRDWDNGERTGTNVEIEAHALGHDLSWGTTTFNRNVLVREPAEVKAEQVNA